MTHPKFIRDQRKQDLASFRETLAGFDGVGEHLEAMARAGTGQGLSGRDVPREDDHLGNAAHNAAALNALAQVIAEQQARIEELEARLDEDELLRAEVGAEPKAK